MADPARIFIPVCPECGAIPGTWAGMIKAAESADEDCATVYCLRHEDEDRELRPAMVLQPFEQVPA